MLVTAEGPEGDGFDRNPMAQIEEVRSLLVVLA
jgi:hypothetical protein